MRTGMGHLARAASAAALTIAAAASAAAAQDVAIRNATILTITNGTIENGTVLVRGGKITAVGRDVPVPAGVQVIDGTGTYVMPGMIDAHSHMAMEGGINEGSESVTPEVVVNVALNVARSEDEAERQSRGEDVTVVKEEKLELETFNPEMFEERAAPAEAPEGEGKAEASKE